MKRFFNNGDSDKNDEFNYDEDADEGEGEDFRYLDADEYLDTIQFELVEKDLSQKLLRTATEIASSDWFWAFRSTEKKIQAVEMVYNRLSLLLTDNIKPVEEQKEEE